MKRIALLFVSIFCVGSLSAQNLFKAKTDKVTMYFGQALVEKSVRVDLQEGDNVLLLDGNSSYLQDNTVQFAVSEDFMLTDYNVVMVSSENLSSYEENLPEKERRQYRKLCDTITILKELLREKESYKAILKKESATLSGLKVMSQPQTVDSLPGIKSTLDYYRKKMLEITKEEIANDKKIEEYTESLKQQEHLLKVFKEKYPEKQVAGKVNGRTKRIIANIYSEKPLSGVDFSYSYICPAAYWSPQYDIRLSSDEERIRFVLKAIMQNWTCEDWNEVDLVFSSEVAQSIGDRIAVLQPFNISNQNYEIVEHRIGLYEARDAKTRANLVYTAEEEEVEEELAMYSISNYTALTRTSDGLFGKEYVVGRKHDIKADGNLKTIPLKTVDAKVEYRYIIKPKIAPRAYLQAAIPDWQKLELTDAPANVYFDNKMSATTQINPSQTQSDTLLLSLGTDKRIAVSRNVNKTTPSKTSIIGKELETIVEVKIQIKNNSMKNADLDLEDQIPITDDVNIKIQALDLQGANYDPISGSLKWKKQLKAGESLNLKVKYSVRYPKDYKLDLN